MIILDEQSKKWEVQLPSNASYPKSATNRQLGSKGLILERWTIQLGPRPNYLPADLNNVLPLVYKKAIVLFRSLFTYSAFLPAWNFSKKLAKTSSRSNLRLQYRILAGPLPVVSSSSDGLTAPLYPSQDDVVSEYSFGNTESPAGSFSVNVSYRSNCEFGVDDAESLLSSRFIGTEDEWFKPTWPSDDPASQKKVPPANEVGSLPSTRTNVMPHPDLGQAYGSLSTFHQIGAATGTSPITALRNAQDLGSASPAASPPSRPSPFRRSSNQSSRSSLRGNSEGNPVVGRRTSISFQPFKTPSLSASPSLAPTVFGSSNQSVGRNPILPAVAESQMMPPPPVPSPTARIMPSNVQDNTNNPDASHTPPMAPIPKYTSSFSHRRSRLSSGSITRTEDDQGSSGRASAASSGNQASSVVGTYAANLGHTASVQEDDEKISEFIKMLESKKDLLTPATSAAAEASTRRTTAALNRFHRMRESNAALSESMSASLRRSSSSSSRQLSSLPPMVAATSLSTSSSPSKPVSPHTPHTPAIPSRLSSNSIVQHERRGHHGAPPLVEELGETSEEAPSEDTVEPATSHVPPIDIPTSPPMYVPNFRRSSSAAHRRVIHDEDEVGDFYGLRSASMGAYPGADSAGPAPPVNPGAGTSEEQGDDDGGGQEAEADTAVRPYTFRYHSGTVSTKSARPIEGPESGSGPGASSMQHTHRPQPSRGSGGTGRGTTPLHGSESGGSSSTFERKGGGSGGAASRSSLSRANDQRSALEEDEPLFLPFAMSDIGASRRSLEEARAAQGSLASERDRTAETRRWASKRSGSQAWPS